MYNVFLGENDLYISSQKKKNAISLDALLIIIQFEISKSTLVKSGESVD